MPNFSNFDVYKVTSPTINGYLFSVTENTEEEPTYHYYLITKENNIMTIKKPNNIIDILHTTALIMIDINDSEEEYKLFSQTIETLLSHPIPRTENNSGFTDITPKDMSLLKTN